MIQLHSSAFSQYPSYLVDPALVQHDEEYDVVAEHRQPVPESRASQIILASS